MMGFEVEFLTGTSVAVLPHRREAAEWPPHPDRLFQALVAAWGRNDPPLDDEREALEWLEALNMEGLSVSAPSAHRRSVVPVYVPPNDARTSGKVGDKVPSDLSAAIRVVPEFRKNRQPRSFPAVLPAAEPAAIRYVWRDAPEADRHSEALRRLARQVTYLGHSHTLVRVEFVTIAAESEAVEYGWTNENEAPLRVPFKGRLRDLYRRHEQSKSTGRLVRPAPSLVSRRFQAPARTPQSSNVFDPDNITVLADAGGFDPALEAFPTVAKRLRDALLKSAQDAGLPASPLLSGHDDDGTPTRKPHIAIVPLADVGWSYSQGRLMGLGLLWPRAVAEDDRRNALTALAGFLRGGRRRWAPAFRT
jgi:CRISPR-associated protein Csb2